MKEKERIAAVKKAVDAKIEEISHRYNGSTSKYEVGKYYWAADYPEAIESFIRDAKSLIAQIEEQLHYHEPLWHYWMGKQLNKEILNRIPNILRIINSTICYDYGNEFMQLAYDFKRLKKEIKHMSPKKEHDFFYEYFQVEKKYDDSINIEDLDFSDPFMQAVQKFKDTYEADKDEFKMEFAKKSPDYLELTRYLFNGNGDLHTEDEWEKIDNTRQLLENASKSIYLSYNYLYASLSACHSFLESIHKSIYPFYHYESKIYDTIFDMEREFVKNYISHEFKSEIVLREVDHAILYSIEFWKEKRNELNRLFIEGSCPIQISYTKENLDAFFLRLLRCSNEMKNRDYLEIIAKLDFIDEIIEAIEAVDIPEENSQSVAPDKGQKEKKSKIKPISPLCEDADLQPIAEKIKAITGSEWFKSECKKDRKRRHLILVLIGVKLLEFGRFKYKGYLPSLNISAFERFLIDYCGIVDPQRKSMNDDISRYKTIIQEGKYKEFWRNFSREHKEISKYIK